MQEAATTLEQDAMDVLLRLRGALGRLFEAVAPQIEKASQLQAALGIDKKLAWRLYRFVNESDVMAGSRHLPSATGMEIVIVAAVEKGASEESEGDTRAAFDEYLRVVRSHAGERSSMDMMLASASPRAQIDAARNHQRAAYKANSFIWGVQAKLQLSCLVLNPSADDPDRVDIAAVRGLGDLRRLRSNVPWVIGRVRCTDDDGEIRAPLNLAPLDPQPARADGLPPVPLLRDFCSSPTPQVRRVQGGDRHLEDELVETPVGNTGVVSCFTGEMARAAGVRYRDEHNELADMTIRVRTPLQWLLVDVFVHTDLAPKQMPRLLVYSDVNVTRSTTRRTSRDALLVTDELQRLGRGMGGAYTPLLKQYPDLLGHVFDRAGWDERGFEHYRVAMEYPVMPSSVHVQWALPER